MTKCPGGGLCSAWRRAERSIVVRATTSSLAFEGDTLRPVGLRVDLQRGEFDFAIVGLPEELARAARERLRAALLNSGFEFPIDRIVIRPVPIRLRVYHPGMDLALAIALLAATSQIELDQIADCAFVGELALDGSTREWRSLRLEPPVDSSIRTKLLVVPAGGGVEKALPPGMDIAILRELQELR